MELGHDFYETPQGLRYTISEPALREVLGRFLALNHARYAEEVKAGLHGKKKGKKGSQRKTKASKQTKPQMSIKGQLSLFDS